MEELTESQAHLWIVGRNPCKRRRGSRVCAKDNKDQTGHGQSNQARLGFSGHREDQPQDSQQERSRDMLRTTPSLVTDVTVDDRPEASSKVDGHGDQVRLDLGELETPDDDRQTAVNRNGLIS